MTQKDLHYYLYSQNQLWLALSDSLTKHHFPLYKIILRSLKVDEVFLMILLWVISDHAEHLAHSHVAQLNT